MFSQIKNTSPSLHSRCGSRARLSCPSVACPLTHCLSFTAPHKRQESHAFPRKIKKLVKTCLNIVEAGNIYYKTKGANTHFQKRRRGSHSDLVDDSCPIPRLFTPFRKTRDSELEATDSRQVRELHVFELLWNIHVLDCGNSTSRSC